MIKYQSCKVFSLLFLVSTIINAQINDAFDVLHYQNTISISDTSNQIFGKTGIKLKLTHSVDTLIFNFQDLKIKSIQSLEKNLSYTYINGLIKIENPIKFINSDTLEIIINYFGIPKDGLIIKNNKYGRRTFFADNWPDRAQKWFPCKDELTDKAAVTFIISAPNKYSIVANGKLLRKTNNLNNTTTTSYLETTDIPTYCMVFGAAEFDTYEDINSKNLPLTFWLYPEDFNDGVKEFRRAHQMLEYFSSRFEKYPYSKMALVQSSTIFGGMENAGAIFFDENTIGTASSIEPTVAHEIAHQWFGDYITESEWSDLWLSEGFATFFEWQFFEYADGEEAYKKYLKKALDNYLKIEDLHSRSVIEKKEDLMKYLNGNTYTKAGFVIHMLRTIVGENNFWKGILNYCQTFGSKNVTTEDFQKVMENVTGESLDWFFEQWIYNPGIPYLDISYSWDKYKKQIILNSIQTQKTGTMRFPLEVELNSKTDQIKRIWIDKVNQKFSFNLESEPDKITIDPDIKLLAKINVISEK